ncbi:Pyruvate kinase barrel domain-containing protein [Phytophthora infestans]|uniref:pyruvate kinase n=1 Tax=Phytophthora infestans TaxID=4787 RepID=A0A8S9TY64_PHYIN|nr:Pyruvate kinase barrel domain-containing protein [Phytophthora infestans]
MRSSPARTQIYHVTEFQEYGVVTRTNNSVTLGERKNMNLPSCNAMLPTPTKKDEDDLSNSRLMLRPFDRVIKVIAKIENEGKFEIFGDIFYKTDDIMAARGDLKSVIIIDFMQHVVILLLTSSDWRAVPLRTCYRNPGWLLLSAQKAWTSSAHFRRVVTVRSLPRQHHCASTIKHGAGGIRTLCTIPDVDLSERKCCIELHGVTLVVGHSMPESLR